MRFLLIVDNVIFLPKTAVWLSLKPKSC